LFAFLGSILASLEAIWRGQKNLISFGSQHSTYHRIDLIPILAVRFCNKIDNARGY